MLRQAERRTQGRDRRRTGGRATRGGRTWLFAQRWEQLLFAHWRADVDAIARLLPRPVEPDVRDGSAWIAIVAFVMVGTRTAGRPYWGGLAPIPELNVRTYVRLGDEPGVWFISLDASSPLFAGVGRALYGLRYHVARMATAAEGATVHYLSERGAAAFSASYAPSAAPRPAARGSLEHFLMERYRLFAERRGRLVTAEVAHEPWPLQPAEARIGVNRMAPAGVSFDGEPLLHYVRSVDALISAPEPVASRVALPAPRLRTVPETDLAA